MLTYTKIDLDALAYNYHSIKSSLKENCEICAVVKANAYGHGAVECAKIALKNGCTKLAVARLDEAIKLRKAKIKAPILLFGYADPNDSKLFIKHNITISTSSVEHAKKIDLLTSKKITVHIKVDTGMGRIGKLSNKVVNDIVEISNLKNIYVEGLYTHLSSADEENEEFTLKQIENFDKLISQLETKGISIPILHCSNSAGIFKYPQANYNMVRPGIIQYGLMPSKIFTSESTNTKPVMSMYSTIVEVKELPANYPVSYGATYMTDKKTKTAVVAVGYADGYFRQLSNRGYMIVNNQKCNILGRVCMDLTVIDVSNIDDVKVGDPVLIFGNNLLVDKLATLADTINYDITSKVAQRVPRIFINQTS